MTIESMIDATIGKEGGYVNNPNDRGGPTNWGITEAVARRNGYAGDMRNLSRSVAFDIYKREYAIRPGFTAVAEINSAVAEELFDTGVNQGPATASKFLQKALNLLNRGGKLYADIAEDGVIGRGTLAALTSFKAARGSDGIIVLLKVLNILQGYRYIEIASKNPSQEEFIYGWINSRINL